MREDYEGQTDLSVLMEREDEMQCDVQLYKDELLRLQLKLQKKQISLEEYTESYDSISTRKAKLEDKLGKLSLEINSRIQDYDEFDDISDIDLLNEYYDSFGEFHETDGSYNSDWSDKY